MDCGSVWSYLNGKMVHPAPETGIGSECDKLSKEAIETHYNGMIGKLVKDIGPLAGKTLVSAHVDSCEHGAQNWTPKMREEFKRLRGYDMMPFRVILLLGFFWTRPCAPFR